MPDAEGDRSSFFDLYLQNRKREAKHDRRPHKITEGFAMQVGVCSDLPGRGRRWGSWDLLGGLANEGRARTVLPILRPCRGTRKLPRGYS